MSANHQSTNNPTQGFVFNHTMLRVKDPAKSLVFYQDILGMTLLRTHKNPEHGFDLYFLARLTEQECQNLPPNEHMKAFLSQQRGVLELTHNYGTEDDATFAYHNGNSEPRGFGHICFAVPDLQEAVQWFDKNGIEFVKRPEEGNMKDIAFVKDPDGYWVEIIEIKAFE